MSQLHLPARHTDADLALAGSVARLLGSAELYVAWSTDGGTAKPVIPATVHTPSRLPEGPVIGADAPSPQPTLEVPALTVKRRVPAPAPAPVPATPPSRRRRLLARLRARRRR